MTGINRRSFVKMSAGAAGGLVLGFGFRLSDIVCYAIGVGLAALMDAWSLRRGRREDIVS